MTKTIAITALALFSLSAQAADSYREFTAGNPDSSNPLIKYESVTAVQPGIGSDIDRYQGIGRGNPDLFNVDLEAAFNRERERSERPNIYGPLSRNPDLSF
jgi:predicted membrane-bound mannosyltransferase